MIQNEELKEGMIVKGSVASMQPYGAFIKTDGGNVGLLHIENISVSRIKDPSERFKIGQKIDVMVKSINNENNRITFTYKELCGTWEENVKGIKEKTVVKGIARETDKYKNGIFVELKPNLVGLADYEEDIQYGQEVQVYVKKIIPDKKKIKLLFFKEEEENGRR